MGNFSMSDTEIKIVKLKTMISQQNRYFHLLLEVLTLSQEKITTWLALSARHTYQ